MTAIEPITAAATARPDLSAVTASDALAGAANPAANGASFGDAIMQGLQGVENRIDTANDLVRRFTLDDSVPIHDVTVALEQARLAVELALQVRTQLLEGYRQIMNMQL